VVQALALIAVGSAPFAGVLAATLTVGLTAGLASPLLAGAFLLQMAYTLSRRQVRRLRADGTVTASHPA
jgi:hypothetical protein